MAFAFIQSNHTGNGGSATTSLAVGYNSNNTLNNLLIMVSREPAGSGNTYLVTDSLGNTWTNGIKFSNGGDQMELFYVTACKAGANTVTVTKQGGGTFFYRMVIAEFSGVAVNNPLDVTGSNTGTTTANPFTTFVTPTQTIELLIGFISNSTADSVSPIADGTWTALDNQDGNLTSWYKTLPVTQPSSWSASMVSAASQGYASAIVALQAASSGTAVPAVVRTFGFVQGSGGGATSVTSGATALTSGDTAIITVYWNDQSKTVTSVTDTAGNTWSAVANTLRLVPGGSFALQCWVSSLTNTSASATITANFSGSTPFPALEGMEFSNINTSTPVATSTGAATTAVPGTPTISPTGNLVLWAAFFTNNGNKSSTPPWIGLANSNNAFNESMYQLVLGNSGKYNLATETSSKVSWGAAIAGFAAPIIGKGNIVVMFMGG
jgi:hypothetical protein